ncbi:MAG: dienelactone hydrolase family protein [Acidobacteriales bacterium]|nr:dienelactone hydrolase family protein [Terriglobales bacterium]
MKRFALCFALLAFTASAFAAEGKTVTYKSGSDTISGVLYAPAKTMKGKLPAIVIIHEWWGLNDWVKEQASKWADQGYVTLAVDLYRGKVATDRDMAHELMRGLDQERAVADMRAGIAYLKALPNVDAARIGSIGWCMGGSMSFRLAVGEPTLKAAVINYGGVTSDPAVLGKIKASILGIFGGQDRGIPLDDVTKMAAELKKQKKSVDIRVYPEAGHGFQNPNNQGGYRAEDTADAWKLQTEFFAKSLKK